MTHQSSNTRLRPVIRVFISSTFSDMKHERNALQDEVFPQLEQLCVKQGFQFQAIDLRWGVSTEAGLDHRTMRICFDELRRAQEISPRPNFLILLGDRYGWRPLPEEISVEEFTKLAHAATAIAPTGGDAPSATSALREWYRVDTNAIPPVYLLQSRRQRLPDGKDYTLDASWLPVQEMLWAIINDAMPPEQLSERFEDTILTDDAPPPIVRYQASATEQEIWHGALRVPDAQAHVLTCFRQIRNLDEFPEPARLKEFVDVTPSGAIDAALAAEQKRLKDTLARRLGEGNVSPHVARLVTVRDQHDQPAIDVTTNHLDHLCHDMESRLTRIIQEQIDAYWLQTVPASADRAARELEIERDEHARFGQERGARELFVGREVELEAIRTYVRNASPWPLVVHGASGCGKTALLARAAEENRQTDGDVFPRARRTGPRVRLLRWTSWGSAAHRAA